MWSLCVVYYRIRPSLSSFFFLFFLSSLVVCLTTFSLILCVCSITSRTHIGRPHRRRRRRRRTTSLSRVARGSVRRSRKKRGSALDTHTHTERERRRHDSLILSLSLSRFLVVVLSGSLQISLRFWRLENFVFLFVVKVVYVVVVSFRLFDDVEKSCFFALLRHEEAQRRRGDDGGFEGRAETRGNDETIRAAGRRTTTTSNWGKKHQ